MHTFISVHTGHANKTGRKLEAALFTSCSSHAVSSKLAQILKAINDLRNRRADRDGQAGGRRTGAGSGERGADRARPTAAGRNRPAAKDRDGERAGQEKEWAAPDLELGYVLGLGCRFGASR